MDQNTNPDTKESTVSTLPDVNQSFGADLNQVEETFSTKDQLTEGILSFDYPNSAIIGDVSPPISCENESLSSCLEEIEEPVLDLISSFFNQESSRIDDNQKSEICYHLSSSSLSSMIGNDATITFQPQVLSTSIEVESGSLIRSTTRESLLMNSETSRHTDNNYSAPKVGGNQSLYNCLNEIEDGILIWRGANEESATLDNGEKKEYSFNPSLDQFEEDIFDLGNSMLNLENSIVENIDPQEVKNSSKFYHQFENESTEFLGYPIINSYGNVSPRSCESQDLDACLNEIEKDLYELTLSTSQKNSTFQNCERIEVDNYPDYPLLYSKIEKLAPILCDDQNLISCLTEIEEGSLYYIRSSSFLFVL
jgi:hypothetical protein